VQQASLNSWNGAILPGYSANWLTVECNPESA
jgi:hypothetical protein